MAATKLWAANAVEDWEEAWSAYDATLAGLKKDKLVELDTWVSTTLRSALRGRDPRPFLTQPELVKLMEWKLKKGKWRPALMKYATSLSEKEVKIASIEAFEIAKKGDLKGAIAALTELKGIGPATASAVLAAYDDDIPFMADEALDALASIIGPRKYTLPHYLKFAEMLRTKAKWLNDQDAGDWSPQRVQLCLFVAAHRGAPPKPKPKTTKVLEDVRESSVNKAKPSKRKAVDDDASTEVVLRRSSRRRTSTR